MENPIAKRRAEQARQQKIDTAKKVGTGVGVGGGILMAILGAVFSSVAKGTTDKANGGFINNQERYGKK